MSYLLSSNFTDFTGNINKITIDRKSKYTFIYNDNFSYKIVQSSKQLDKIIEYLTFNGFVMEHENCNEIRFTNPLDSTTTYHYYPHKNQMKKHIRRLLDRVEN